MAAQFIGAHMVVTLHDPPTNLRGVVTNVRSGQSLTLTDVWSVAENIWLYPHLTIEAANVANLVEVPSPSGAPADSGSQPTAAAAALATTSLPPQAFPPADPAIIAVGRPPPSDPRPQSERSLQPNTGVERGIQTSHQVPREATLAATVHWSVEAPPVGNKDIEDTKDMPGVKDTIPSLEPPGTYPSPPADPPASDVQSQNTIRRKNGRPRRGRNGRNATQDDAAGAQPASRHPGPALGSGGWRQTPILEDTTTFQPFNSLRKARAKGGNAQHRDAGWASEDATDVQEMGEFDFEGGLAKFDKHTLFDQMRKDDQTDDASRLVAHNRQQRPKTGTAGGKTLHYTENVLDLPAHGPRVPKELPNDFWNSEADDGLVAGAERLSGREQGSRQSSRRGESKISTTRRSQSRKANATAAATTAGGAQGQARTGSGSTAPTPGFLLLPSNRRVDTVSALQMLNLENIAHNELGFTEEMMTENSGRGIAEVALIALADPAVRLRADSTPSAPSAPYAGSDGKSTPASPGASGKPQTTSGTVAVLAGNNKSGIRAVAAARHLRNKGVDILMCVVGLERGDRDLLEGMRQQLRLFRNFGGRVYGKSELFEHVRKLSIPTLTIDTPRGVVVPKPPAVSLIIDALLGLATPFEELRVWEQATVYELIEWANRNEAFTLSVDMPTGIDPSTGKASIVDGNRLYVQPRYVVAMGAPKRGLLEALSSSEALGDKAVYATSVGPDDSVTDWKLFVIDIGLGSAVWKKAGTKTRMGIEWGDQWVIEINYKT